MQERYLGDSHDFVKYSILLALHTEFGGPLGLNWYLTRPEEVDPASRKDGEKRHHLTQPEWFDCDAGLVKALSHFVDHEHRSITAFEASGILPASTIFHRDLVPLDRKERAIWHQAAVSRLAPCSIVFLDPDNGFEVSSMTTRTKPKYALHEEADDYRRGGKITVSIQFARQCDPIRRARDVGAIRARSFPNDAQIPVLRGRLAPNLLFFFGAPDSAHRRLIGAIESLIERLPTKLEWVRPASESSS